MSANGKGLLQFKSYLDARSIQAPLAQNAKQNSAAWIVQQLFEHHHLPMFLHGTGVQKLLGFQKHLLGSLRSHACHAGIVM